jgi:bis(5'-nucleosyl)-tetraphosphatase (symmetrical)
MAHFIVGDVQGCYSGLRKLLDKTKFDPKQDTLVGVGDLIGRGPQAKKTLDFFLSLKQSATSVLGNHDLHFLGVVSGVRKVKERDQFDTLLASEKLDRYVDWLRNRPLALRLNKHYLVTHAGLYPQWSFKQAIKLSDEISQQLQSKKWKLFFQSMYGDQPEQWADNLAEEARYRFVINAMTRMRYLSDKNRLDFAHKIHPDRAPQGIEPWFAIANPNLKKRQKVIFGHWATLSGQTQNERFIGLDTGYIWGGEMTVLILEREQKLSLANRSTF